MFWQDIGQILATAVNPLGDSGLSTLASKWSSFLNKKLQKWFFFFFNMFFICCLIPWNTNLDNIFVIILNSRQVNLSLFTWHQKQFLKNNTNCIPCYEARNIYQYLHNKTFLKCVVPNLCCLFFSCEQNLHWESMLIGCVKKKINQKAAKKRTQGQQNFS